MFTTQQPLILASNSPRRKEFFEQAGLKFSVCSANVDESIQRGEAPEQYVRRLACAKAEAVSLQYPVTWVVGADTIVVCDDQILGKPVDEEDAVNILLKLSDRKHLVMTAFCVVNIEAGVTESGLGITEVVFDAISSDTARAYAATGEPLDKAGAYGIQGIGGMLVKKINGSYSNVVGLPMAEVLGLLRRLCIVK